MDENGETNTSILVEEILVEEKDTLYRTTTTIKLYGLLESYLKNNGLVVLLEVEGKDVSEHECGAALAEHVHSLL